MGKTSFDAKRTNCFMLEPNTITIPAPGHPLYDERSKTDPDEAMILNVIAHGIIEPVVIRKEGDQAVVVAGRRRVRAAQLANERLRKQGEEAVMVPCIIRRGDDREMLGVAVSENEIRKADTPMVRARKMQHLLELGRVEGDIAIIFGVTKQTVKNHLKLFDLCPQVQNAVEAGTISATAASQLSDMPPAEQKKALDDLEASGDTTVRATKETKEGREVSDKPRCPSKKEMKKALEAISAKYNTPPVPGMKEMMLQDQYKTLAYMETLDWVLGNREDAPWTQNAGKQQS